MQDSNLASTQIQIRHRVADNAQVANFSQPVLLGRDRDCDIHFDDARIARRHAEIYRVDDVWWIRDLGSDSGTYLDDEFIDAAPVVTPATVQLGDEGPVIWLEPTQS